MAAWKTLSAREWVSLVLRAADVEDVVARFSKPMEAALVAELAKKKGDIDPRAFELLLRMRSPRVTEALTAQLHVRRLSKRIAAYLDRNAKLAKPVLAAATKRRGAAGRAAQALTKDLPPIALAAGGELAADDALLATIERGIPLAGVDPISQESFLIALGDRWLSLGASLTNAPWVLGALASSGGDRALAWIAASARVLVEDRAFAQAKRCVAALRGARTADADFQLAVLHEVPALREAIEHEVAAEALARTPTFGFDREGRRADGIQLQDDLSVSVRRETPIFRAVRENVAAAVRLESVRLERAMCEGTPVPEFFIRRANPLLSRIDRRVLFGVQSERGALAFAFRPTEDGAYAGLDDRPVDIPKNARVVVVHPVALDPEHHARAGDLFASYEIVQPFEQLARACTRLDDELAAKTELDEWARKKIPSTRLIALYERGWRFVNPWGDVDPRSIHGMRKSRVTIELRDQLRCKLEGTLVDDGSPKAVTIESVKIHFRKPQPLGSLGPIAASELLRDLATLRE